MWFCEIFESQYIASTKCYKETSAVIHQRSRASSYKYRTTTLKYANIHSERNEKNIINRPVSIHVNIYHQMIQAK